MSFSCFNTNQQGDSSARVQRGQEALATVALHGAAGARQHILFPCDWRKQTLTLFHCHMYLSTYIGRNLETNFFLFRCVCRWSPTQRAMLSWLWREVWRWDVPLYSTVLLRPTYVENTVGVWILWGCEFCGGVDSVGVWILWGCLMFVFKLTVAPHPLILTMKHGWYPTKNLIFRCFDYLVSYSFDNCEHGHFSRQWNSVNASCWLSCWTKTANFWLRLTLYGKCQ